MAETDQIQELRLEIATLRLEVHEALVEIQKLRVAVAQASNVHLAFTRAFLDVLQFEADPCREPGGMWRTRSRQAFAENQKFLDAL